MARRDPGDTPPRRGGGDVASQVVASATLEISSVVGPLGPAARRAIETAIKLEVETILRAVEAKRRLSPLEIDSIIEIGTNESPVRIPGYVLMRIHRLAIRAAWATLLARGHKDGSAGITRARTAIHLIEAQLLSEAARNALRSMERKTATLTPTTPLRRLLEGGQGEADAARLGLKAPAFVCATVAVDAGASTDIAHDLAAKAAAAMIAPSFRIVVEKTDAWTVVLVPCEVRDRPGPVGDALARTFTDHGNKGHPFAGVGRSEPGLDGVHRSYVQANRALDVVRRTPALPRVLHYDHALPYVLMASSPIVMHEALEGIFRPVERAGQELVETLEAFIDSGASVAAVAERLGLHRHTVSQRLAKIERITGRSLRDPRDQLALTFGIVASRVAGADRHERPAR